MSAIQSLLRVMTLRDAEAIVLEAGKVPSLRRRGQAEAMAMPPLDGELLAEFIRSLTEGRGVPDLPAVLPFTDASGTAYAVSLERAGANARVIVRPGKPAGAAQPSKMPAAPAAKP